MTDLRRHVPPITLTWDEEAPGARWRVVDGTLVFADVTGFTALTERLSARGRIGAEEIVEALNRVFGPMLHIAAARGGELLKFGGDALLFLFRGSDHAEQACDAAVEMRSALRRAAAQRTSVGRMSLSMSVGVHSGDVHLFLVGAPSRELLVLGPGASHTAQAERAAQAGQVVVSPGTAARLAPGSTRPSQDGALLLRRRRAHSAAGRPAPTPRADPGLLRTLFPHELGEYLAPGPPDPEHRIACIAFIRFSGTDALLAAQGPGPLADLLHEMVTTVEEALAAEGVTMLATDLDTDGGKFFLGSGVPASHDDDEGRMVRALRRIADAGIELPLQLGINQGHVFAAEVGIAERAAYAAMGDTTNTAARITAKAPPGSIYAHPAVLESSRTLFAVAPAGPFRMKGKAVPLLVYDVGEEIGTRASTTGRRLPFLGRQAQVEDTRAALSVALRGAGGVVTIEGATGMGKSRLAAEALDGAPAAQRLWLRAEPYGASSAFRIFRDPLRSLLGITRAAPHDMGRQLTRAMARLAPGLLPLAPLLADVVQVSVPTTAEVELIDPEFRPDRLADVVIALLEAAVTGPLAVVVEEAHWADGASVALLERLAVAAAGRPWALIAVRRGNNGGFVPDSGLRVALGPLPRDVIERLVIAATEATPLRPHEVATIVDRAEGNPLFVEEVTRVALGVGSLAALPESVQGAMSTQIDLLPAPVRRILRHCAVLGRSFRVEVLEATLETDGLALGPSTLVALADLLEPDGPQRMRFRNALVRDAAYEGLAYRLRTRIHRAAGEALEQMSTDPAADSPTLALHFARGGDAERTWRYAQMAAALARRSYANADAAAHLEVALDAGRRLPGVTDADRAALWSQVGELKELAGMLEESVEAYRRVARLSWDDPVATAEALARQATVHERAGDHVRALRVVSRARRLVEGRDDDRSRGIAVRLDALTGVIRFDQDRPHDARRWAQRAANAARAIGDHEGLVRALMFIDFADLQLGRSGVGSHTREALQICLEHGYRARESIARANLGAYAYYAGRWDEAMAWYQSSRAAAMEAGNAFGAAETDVNIGELLINQGRLTQADDVLRDAVRILRASGIASFVAQGEMQLARVSLGRGDLARADERAARATREFAALGESNSALEAALVRAEVATAAGQPDRALQLIGDAERDAHEAALLLPRRCLQRARALLALERPEEAAVQLDIGLASARDQGLPYEEALLLLAVSQLHRQAGAPQDAERAKAQADRLLESLGARR